MRNYKLPLSVSISVLGYYGSLELACYTLVAFTIDNGSNRGPKRPQ